MTWTSEYHGKMLIRFHYSNGYDFYVEPFALWEPLVHETLVAFKKLWGEPLVLEPRERIA
jgi:hypothetical protein